MKSTITVFAFAAMCLFALVANARELIVGEWFRDVTVGKGLIRTSVSFGEGGKFVHENTFVSATGERSATLFRAEGRWSVCGKIVEMSDLKLLAGGDPAKPPTSFRWSIVALTDEVLTVSEGVDGAAPFTFTRKKPNQAPQPTSGLAPGRG
jgi:hypothetical protein